MIVIVDKSGKECILHDFCGERNEKSTLLDGFKVIFSRIMET